MRGSVWCMYVLALSGRIMQLVKLKPFDPRDFVDDDATFRMVRPSPSYNLRRAPALVSAHAADLIFRQSPSAVYRSVYPICCASPSVLSRALRSQCSVVLLFD